MSKLTTFKLTPPDSNTNLGICLQKINDYLLTYVGEIEVRVGEKNSLLVSYPGTKLQAALKIDQNGYIALSCNRYDHLSVNLLKNIVKNIGLRIFSNNHKCFLATDPNLLDLSTSTVDKKILNIISQFQLKPLFQLNQSLVFFCQDKKGQIHLINRHLLEYLKDNPTSLRLRGTKKEFSLVVASNVGHFVALFDRGLIPFSFYKTHYNDTKIVNLSGFDIDKLTRKIRVEKITFLYDQDKQTFSQNNSDTFDLKSGTPLLTQLKLKDYLAVKIALDVGFKLKNKGLMPQLKVMVFLDN